MRQVDRTLISVPPCLDEVTERHLQAIREGKRPNGKIYRHQDVISGLRDLYLHKCYLCERIIEEDDGEVEHFHPWHRELPKRAYDWNNLNWCCRACNQRKRRDEFKKKIRNDDDDSPVETLLVDPSNPPFQASVEELIRFDADDQKAVGNSLPNDQDKVIDRTVKFLNDETTWHFRRAQLKRLVNTALELGYVLEWRALILEPEIAPANWDPSVRSDRIDALRCAHNFYDRFLADHVPYSACMRAALSEWIVDVTVKGLERLSREFLAYEAGLLGS